MYMVNWCLGFYTLAYLGFVASEAYAIWGTTFQEENTKLRKRNYT